MSSKDKLSIIEFPYDILHYGNKVILVKYTSDKVSNSSGQELTIAEFKSDKEAEQYFKDNYEGFMYE